MIFHTILKYRLMDGRLVEVVRYGRKFYASRMGLALHDPGECVRKLSKTKAMSVARDWIRRDTFDLAI